MVRDERNLEGKTCIFNTHGTDSEWKSHDGEKCKVKMRKLETYSIIAFSALSICR